MKPTYVAGFLMDFRMDRFLIIDKTNKEKLFGPGIRLKRQAIGGRIKEPFETVNQLLRRSIAPELPHDAMTREFFEETGTTINPKLWHCFIIKEYQEAKVYLFAAFLSPNILDKIVAESKHIECLEGEIKAVDLVDVYFDSEKFTFDTSVFITFIKLEMMKGFWAKLDPEGINSAYKAA